MLNGDPSPVRHGTKQLTGPKDRSSGSPARKGRVARLIKDLGPKDRSRCAWRKEIWIGPSDLAWGCGNLTRPSRTGLPEERSFGPEGELT